MCIHCSVFISPMRAPVSLSVCSRVAVLSFPCAIRVSSSCSVGMNGSPLSCVYFGHSHVLFMYFRYPL